MPNANRLPISVIIPSYNHEKFIGEAIESVLSQTKAPEEILVVDDFSMDKSLKILEKFAKHVRIIGHIRNLGGAATLNTGIQNTNKEYVAILNSDDTWVADKLEKQLDYMNSKNIDVCFTNANIIDSDSKLISNPPDFFSVFNLSEPTGGNFLHHFFYRGNFLCHPSMFAKREMFSKFGHYNAGLEQLPDFAKWIDFTKGGKMGILPEKLANYRYLPGQNASSRRVTHNQIRTRNELFLIFSSFFDGLPKNIIEEVFAFEIAKLDDVSQELARIDPGTALLLNHPERSLADQALYAGIARIWRNSQSSSTVEREILRAELGKIEVSASRLTILESMELKKIKAELWSFAKKSLGSMRNVK